MANTKRKDKSRKVLRKGESQRPDGTYQFRWTDENRKRHCIYARNLDDLRYKEDEIDKDKKDGIKAEARYTYISQAFQIRNNTDYADFFLVSLQDAKEQYDRAEEFVKVIEEFLKME